jgi:hypothetical protein
MCLNSLSLEFIRKVDDDVDDFYQEYKTLQEPHSNWLIKPFQNPELTAQQDPT